VAHVAAHVAHELNDPDALVVCILPDTGERYLSTLLYQFENEEVSI